MKRIDTLVRAPASLWTEHCLGFLTRPETVDHEQKEKKEHWNRIKAHETHVQMGYSIRARGYYNCPWHDCLLLHLFVPRSRPLDRCAMSEFFRIGNETFTRGNHIRTHRRRRRQTYRKRKTENYIENCRFHLLAETATIATCCCHTHSHTSARGPASVIFVVAKFIIKWMSLYLHILLECHSRDGIPTEAQRKCREECHNKL